MSSAESPAALERERAAVTPSVRAPDFYIVGHAKCGTTALYEMLRVHPRIYMPDLKEPAYFATDLRTRFKRHAAGDLPETLEDYLRLFADAPAGRLVGEASSLYLWSREAARNIAELRPDARIVAILREPASFLRSLHMQLVQNHIESEKRLGRAIALEPERRRGRRIPRRSVRPQALFYSERVRYAEQLRRYHDVFAREQVLVLIYEEFRRDNDRTLRAVQRFLGVEDTVPIVRTEANPSVRLRSHRLDDLVHAVSVGRGPVSRALKGAIKGATPARARGAALRAVRRRVLLGSVEPPDERLMLELRRRFRGEVEAVSEYLGRDLVSLWGYDRLA